MSNNKCAPKYKNEKNSCFTIEALQIIVNAYNNKNPQNPIVIKSNNKDGIWKKIQEKLEKKCNDDELCWLNMDFLREYQDLKKYFKPLAPAGRYKWLSTTDIDNVMKQYEELYPSFKFVGALPMDFAKLTYDDSAEYINKLNLQDEKNKGYKQIGVIFNLDPSTEAGSHWVAFNIDISNKILSYYDCTGQKNMFPNKTDLMFVDSYGKVRSDKKIPVPPEVQELIKKLQQQGTYYIRVNTIQHQYAGSECGVYSMSFLIGMINKDFDTMSKTVVTDEETNQMRNIYFRY